MKQFINIFNTRINMEIINHLNLSAVKHNTKNYKKFKLILTCITVKKPFQVQWLQ